MKPFKLRILQEEDELFWNDFYLDVEQICGFYVVPEAEFIQNELVMPIVIYVNGENYTIKPEKHFQDYLMKRFVNKCVEI